MLSTDEPPHESNVTVVVISEYFFKTEKFEVPLSEISVTCLLINIYYISVLFNSYYFFTTTNFDMILFTKNE
jgi:hypothetical protein